jgi:serine kinase of HPr protein (carbohydrate metabolism regulator)
VALGNHAAILRGESGCGKSDLALRFLALSGEGALRPALVADDRVWVEGKRDGWPIASAPDTIGGIIEVRGLGIAEMPFLAEVPLVLVCDLVEAEAVPRMPTDPWERTKIAGVEIAVLKLSAFEASAPLKLKMALLLASEQ